MKDCQVLKRIPNSLVTRSYLPSAVFVFVFLLFFYFSISYVSRLHIYFAQVEVKTEYMVCFKFILFFVFFVFFLFFYFFIFFDLEG